MERELLHAMSAFKWWYDGCKAVNRFFLQHWSKNLFLASCASLFDPPKPREDIVRSKLLLHRWGSLAHFLKEVLNAQLYLQTTWDWARVLGVAMTDLPAEDQDEISWDEGEVSGDNASEREREQANSKGDRKKLVQAVQGHFQ